MTEAFRSRDRLDLERALARDFRRHVMFFKKKLARSVCGKSASHVAKLVA
jgi:hypothetical protein